MMDTSFANKPVAAAPGKVLGDFMLNVPSITPELGRRGIETFRTTDDWYIVINPIDYINHGVAKTNLVQRAVDFILNHRFYIKIPKGTSTNFATIPAPARMLISKVDPVIVLSSIAHDFLVGEYETPPADIKDILYVMDKEGNLVKVFDPDGDGKPAIVDGDDLAFIADYFLFSKLITGGSETAISWITAAKVFYDVAKLFAGRTATIKRFIAYAAILVKGWIKGKL